VIGTAPVPAGLTAVISESETKVNEAAALGPKLTAVTPVKFKPVIVTVSPPAGAPEAGLIPVTAGMRVLADPGAAVLGLDVARAC
jgi:hypothetical protein